MKKNYTLGLQDMSLLQEFKDYEKFKNIFQNIMVGVTFDLVIISESIMMWLSHVSVADPP